MVVTGRGSRGKSNSRGRAAPTRCRWSSAVTAAGRRPAAVTSSHRDEFELDIAGYRARATTRTRSCGWSGERAASLAVRSGIGWQTAYVPDDSFGELRAPESKRADARATAAWLARHECADVKSSRAADPITRTERGASRGCAAGDAALISRSAGNGITSHHRRREAERWSARNTPDPESVELDAASAVEGATTEGNGTSTCGAGRCARPQELSAPTIRPPRRADPRRVRAARVGPARARALP